MSNHTIMIVEDEPLLRDAYVIILESNGYDVLKAENGYEAIELLSLGTMPNLILLDMLMPKLDGLGFLEQSHITVDHPEIPVVLFSNFSNSSQQNQLGGYGVKEIILKSQVGPAELLAIVAKYTA